MTTGNILTPADLAAAGAALQALAERMVDLDRQYRIVCDNLALRMPPDQDPLEWMRDTDRLYAEAERLRSLREECRHEIRRRIRAVVP